MLDVVTSVLRDLFVILKQFFTQFFFGTSAVAGYLLPVFAIGIAIAVVFLVIKIVLKICWGR